MQGNIQTEMVSKQTRWDNLQSLWPSHRSKFGSSHYAGCPRKSCHHTTCFGSQPLGWITTDTQLWQKKGIQNLNHIQSRSIEFPGANVNRNPSPEQTCSGSNSWSLRSLKAQSIDDSSPNRRCRFTHRRTWGWYHESSNKLDIQKHWPVQYSKISLSIIISYLCIYL